MALIALSRSDKQQRANGTDEWGSSGPTQSFSYTKQCYSSSVAHIQSASAELRVPGNLKLRVINSMFIVFLANSQNEQKRIFMSANTSGFTGGVCTSKICDYNRLSQCVAGKCAGS